MAFYYTKRKQNNLRTPRVATQRSISPAFNTECIAIRVKADGSVSPKHEHREEWEAIPISPEIFLKGYPSGA